MKSVNLVLSNVMLINVTNVVKISAPECTNNELEPV